MGAAGAYGARGASAGLAGGGEHAPAVLDGHAAVIGLLVRVLPNIEVVDGARGTRRLAVLGVSPAGASAGGGGARGFHLSGPTRRPEGRVQKLWRLPAGDRSPLGFWWWQN
jgi:hypothetical protein